MKEIVILCLVAVSAVFLLGYSIHMLIGGLVTTNTEFWVICFACAVGTAIVFFMAWDILRQRRAR